MVVDWRFPCYNQTYLPSVDTYEKSSSVSPFDSASEDSQYHFRWPFGTVDLLKIWDHQLTEVVATWPTAKSSRSQLTPSKHPWTTSSRSSLASPGPKISPPIWEGPLCGAGCGDVPRWIGSGKGHRRNEHSQCNFFVKNRSFKSCWKTWCTIFC